MSDDSKENVKNDKVVKNPTNKGKKRGFVVLLAILVILVSAGVAYAYSQKMTIQDLRNLINQVEEMRENVPQTVVVCVRNDISGSVYNATEEWSGSSALPSEAEVNVTKYSSTHDENCDVVVSAFNEDSYDLVWQRYYSAVANISSPLSDITEDQLMLLLSGDQVSVAGVDVEIVVDDGIFDSVDRMLGIGIGVEASDDAIAQVTASKNVVAVVPFESVSYKVKEVTIDGTSLLKNESLNNESLATYPLVEEVWVNEGEYDGLFAELRGVLGDPNYDPEKISTVIVTGTSVVGSRGLYLKSIEMDDWLYPIRNIGSTLREADVAHISNEASFVEGCEQNIWTLSFCGPIETFEGLTWAGIDVVGLTGNHILDYGDEGFISTLAKFDEAGIQYFGGGKDYADAHTAAIINVGGSKVAFLGYNMIPPTEYYAEGANPGSAALEESAITADIAKIKNEVDFIFVDMQWGDEYERLPNAYQVQYGHAAIDAGADVVSGVHPHWVQPVEYYKDGVIFYGLGNFLFDQLWSLETREGIMVRHYLYDDRYVGFEILPTLISENLQTELAIGDDRARIMDYVIGSL